MLVCLDRFEVVVREYVQTLENFILARVPSKYVPNVAECIQVDCTFCKAALLTGVQQHI